MALGAEDTKRKQRLEIPVIEQIRKDFEAAKRMTQAYKAEPGIKLPTLIRAPSSPYGMGMNSNQVANTKEFMARLVADAAVKPFTMENFASPESIAAMAVYDDPRSIKNLG